ncbi:uncharacterized protein LOC134249474 [Saccostrea cucullata]|uniref:uncharacterized protein LOC134249474 n=1 Tax=Saccostrea cuccullata TaxID=36930 RepID=UPI002ED044EB
MHTAIILIVCVSELLLSDGYVVNFQRRCDCNEVSHGWRKDTWQSDAIHFCVPRGRENKKCEVVNATRGIDCSLFGEHYHLQGGYPKRIAECCEKQGQRLVKCERIPNVFSYRRNIDIMHFDKVLRKLIVGVDPSDDHKFQIELCDVEFDELPIPTPRNITTTKAPATTNAPTTTKAPTTTNAPTTTKAPATTKKSPGGVLVPMI